MPLQTAPYGPKTQVHGGSDIAAIRYDARGLVVKVACEPLDANRFLGLQITFARVSGLRLLDELDLAKYWSSDGFVVGHHVLSVLSGGWGFEENERQEFNTERREWLVVTGNDCLSVFASEAPAIEEGEFDDDA